MIHLDCETRSTIDLKKAGAYRYGEDPTTEVILLAYYDSDTQTGGTWFSGDSPPDCLFDPLAMVAAWNASFERIMYKNILVPRHGFPPLALEQFYDPSAMARRYSLPAGLGACAAALGLPQDQQKDKEGRDLMLKMTKPRRIEGSTIVWWDTPEMRSRLLDYCIQDVVTEYAIYCKLTGKEVTDVRIDNPFKDSTTPQEGVPRQQQLFSSPGADDHADQCTATTTAQ
jgi:DNA polymerase bacteriophage-type